MKTRRILPSLSQAEEIKTVNENLDYDLSACLEYNPQPGVHEDNIVRVLAVWEGENDEDDWRWVVDLDNGKFAFIQGGCDYTGWDCQSWATSVLTSTPEEAAWYARGEHSEVGSLLEPQGFGHMLNILSGSYMNNVGEVYESLMRQLSEGKDKTWRETKDEEFGVTSGAPLPTG